MQPALYLTASSLIIPNQIYRDGNLLYEKSGNATDFLDATYTHFGISYPKFHKMDSLCKLGFLAAEILLLGSDHGKKYAGADTGLILSNARASLDVDLKYVKTIHSGASPALFVYTLPNIVIGEISIRHGFKGENAFFVFKHFDGNFMTQYVTGLFDNHLINNCVCGWVDILKEDYRAFLFLIESENAGNAIPFNAAQMNKLNLQKHG